MHKIKKYLLYIVSQLKRSLQRFPETLVMTSFFVVIAILRNHMSYDDPNNLFMEKLLLTFALGIPLTAGVTLGFEKLKLSATWRVIAQGVAALLLIGYYFLIPSDLSPIFALRYFGLSLILYIVFTLVPYFFYREGYSQYLLHLVGKFFIMLLYAGVIFGGTAMMLFTIDALFELSISDKLYFDLWLLVAGAFGVTYFLGNIPEIGQDITPEHYSKLFKTLFLYILLPIVSVYMVILYAYFGKIVLQRELPMGIIGNLVLWHSLVSVGVLFFVRDLQNDHPWLKTLTQIYIPAMAVPLGMLFLAVGIRIGEYGITMPRYFVIAIGIYALLALLLMRLRKTDTAVSMALLLVAFIAFTFFGAFSGYHMTLSDQNSRLGAMLLETGLKNELGEFIPNANLEEKEQERVSRQIEFLINTYDVEDITALPKAFTPETSEQYLGFKLYAYWYGGSSAEPFTIGEGVYTSPVFKVSDKQFFFAARTYDAFEELPLVEKFSVSKRDDAIVINRNGELHFAVYIEALLHNYYLDPDAPLVIESYSQDLTIEIFVNTANGTLDENGDPVIDYYEVYVIVTFK